MGLSGMSLNQSVSPEQRPLPEGELLRLNDWIELAGWVFVSAVFMIGFIPFIGSFTDDSSGSGMPIAGLVWMAMSLMIADGVRAGLIVDKHGVSVQSLLRRRGWAWSEIERFEIKRPLIRGPVRVRLVNGKTVSTYGLSGHSRAERRLARAWIAELNRRAAAAASSPVDA